MRGSVVYFTLVRAMLATCGSRFLAVWEARFFADCADAESHLLFFRAHLDDLEVVLNSRLEMHLLTVRIHSFGIVAKTLDAFRNFNECAERRHAQDLAVNNVTDAMAIKERLPNIGLKLLHAQRQAALLGINREHYSFHAVALF